jgi:N-acetylneuraminic acid mutarotase
MTVKRNGSACVPFETQIYVFGGNEQDVGSLNSIEKYTIALDKWQMCQVYLREPVHDISSFNLGGNRVLIFGGMSNSKNNTSFHIYDLTCETF